jgi:hypothetical protein
MKRIILLLSLVPLIVIQVSAQEKKEDLKREVTLYNPYIPSLSDFKKKSFLPVISDTSKMNPDFSYKVNTSAYHPEYPISPIKAASLLPDPLPKLYKSYLNLGLGTYISPLAEISITNERSKKGAIGLYARHFSTNGKVKLQNDKRVFAGYMDNDLSLFGKRFFRENYLEGSVDYTLRTRYAYGYDTSVADYDPAKKDIRIGYNNIGGKLKFSSLTLDSADFSYDFDVHYNYFFNGRGLSQHDGGFTGTMAKTYKGFYAGSGVEFEYYYPAREIYEGSKYIASVSPFITKSTSQWTFRLGFQLLLDKDTSSSANFHVYPDARFGFTIVPSYVSFFAGLGGKLEKNNPDKIIGENPFLIRDGSLYTLPNTSHSMIVSAGLNGNTGIGGNYLVSASYSLINNMLFYSNLIFPDPVFKPQVGNLFIPLPDDAELFNLHGEITGLIGNKISYAGNANWYSYTLTENEYPWNKPLWDGQIGVKYNLRNKIIAGIDVKALGQRKLIAKKYDISEPTADIIFKSPVHVNVNVSAEYRYTRILSFWLKVNNIAFNRYYEWAYYPSQRFLCLVGFTYSL